MKKPTEIKLTAINGTIVVNGSMMDGFGCFMPIKLQFNTSPKGEMKPMKRVLLKLLVESYDEKKETPLSFPGEYKSLSSDENEEKGDVFVVPFFPGEEAMFGTYFTTQLGYIPTPAEKVHSIKITMMGENMDDDPIIVNDGWWIKVKLFNEERCSIL